MTKGLRRDIIRINFDGYCSPLEAYIDSICAVCCNLYVFNGNMVASMTQKMQPEELMGRLENLNERELLMVFAKAIKMAAEDMDKLKHENRALRLQVDCLVADAKHVADKGWHPSLTRHIRWAGIH